MIQFLLVRRVSCSVIHCHLIEVCSEGIVRQYLKSYEEGTSVRVSMCLEIMLENNDTSVK